jgi:hypothetical protein
MPNNMKKAGIKYQNGGTGMDGPIPKPKKNPGMPKPENYIGNPLGYFNDKAQYGREIVGKEEPGIADKIQKAAKDVGDTTGAIQDVRQQRLDAKLKRKVTRAKIREAKKQGR